MRRGKRGPGFLFIFALVLSCALAFSLEALATTYYVATNGSDSYNGRYATYQGGTNGPFLTLGRASKMVKAGDTVRIRAGTYQQASSWSANGTGTKPITITNYSGETVVIDGNNHTIPAEEYGTLLRIKGDWYKVSNLEVGYSSCYGIVITAAALHCKVSNCTVHHCWHAGIIWSGSYGLLEKCRAYYNSMQHEYGAGSSWSSGIAVCRAPSHVTVRGCTAWENWGQGIDTYECTHVTVEDCVSYNNGQNFYISDAKYILFQRNMAYCTPGNIIQPYETQNNLLMGDERLDPPSSNNTVINNLFLGGERNLAASGRVLVNCLIAYNTFANAQDTPSECINVMLTDGPGSNTRFLNNIILQEDDVPIAEQRASGVTFSYNNWSRIPPSNCRGAKDVIGDPKLAKTGLTGPGELTPQWFKILVGSAARNRAKVLTQAKQDFFKKLRGSDPDIGAHELK
jgi:hypothetical protein